ncbi:MAG: hypothetical protein F4W93_10655 [Dehalococcoidia bacterium]|nr:hypothetical protein [Dehalococcoidia bacterium]
MASSESSSSPLLWIGGAILAVAAVIIGGFWVYGITTAEDMSVLLLVALLAVPVALAVLLLAAIRDRIIHKKQENFLEVDN